MSLLVESLNSCFVDLPNILVNKKKYIVFERSMSFLHGLNTRSDCLNEWINMEYKHTYKLTLLVTAK